MTKFIIYLNSIIVIIATFFGSSFVPRGLQLDADKLKKTITASNEARIEAGTITGAHVFIKQNGKVMLDEAYGLDGANGKALPKNAVYRIASMTKPITALALLIEHDRGHLSIYDNLTKYMPEFGEMYVSEKDKDGNPVTDENGPMKKGVKPENEIKLYQLVSHVSGVGEVSVGAIGKEKCTCKTAAEWLATQPLVFEPGSMQQYSTGAFDVAARVIEITSGMEFSEYIKVNIFDKLGMKDTTFEPSEEQWSRMVGIHNFADGRVFTENGASGCVFGSFPVTYHAAGAGLASTAEDYMKFALMLLNGGKAGLFAAVGNDDLCALSYKLLGNTEAEALRTACNDGYFA